MRIAGLVATIATVAACGNGPTGSTGGGPILIGVPLAISGGLASVGEDMIKGANLAITQVNASGGVLGRKVQMIAEDDACDSQTGVQAANKLLSEHIVAAVGGICSGASIPESSTFHRSGDIPYVNSNSSNPKLTDQGFDDIFRLSPRDDVMGPADAAFMVTYLHKRRIAILNDNTTYGLYVAQAVRDSATKLGAQVVYFDAITPNQNDYTSALVKVSTLNPDLFYYSGVYPEAALLAKEMGQLHLTFPYQACAGAYDPAFLKIAGAGGAGTYFSVPPFTEFMTSSAASQFKQQFQQAYAETPGAYATYEYDAMKVMFAAMNAAGSTKAADLNRALHATNYVGLTGPITFNARGDRSNIPLNAIQVSPDGSAYKVIASLHNGTYVPVTG